MVQGEKTGKDFLFWQVCRPAVGRENCLVEGAMRVRQPFGALVVEVGQSALTQFFIGSVGRVQPCVAETDEFAGGVGDGFNARGLVLGGFGSGWPRKRKSFKSGRRSIPETAFCLANLGSLCSRPDFMS